MNKFNLLICLLAMTLSVGFTSCAKEKGCTDSNSPSFNTDAEKDDGSCESIADALVGTWNVVETALAIPTSYEADITKVDDNTISITTKNRAITPTYAQETFELDVNWLNKTIGSTNNLNTGTISDVMKLDFSYEVQSSVGSSFIVGLDYTR